MKHIRVVVSILCACFASAASAQQSPSNPLNNWSEFLRTNMQRYNPAETTLSVSNVPDLHPKWFYPLGTDTPSSPVVVNGVVYVQTVSGSFGQMIAVKGGTGDGLWSYLEDIDGGSMSTPAVADGVVYFGNDYGVVQALERQHRCISVEQQPNRRIHRSVLACRVAWNDFCGYGRRRCCRVNQRRHRGVVLPNQRRSGLLAGRGG
jgi:glucose dehydrogenase